MIETIKSNLGRRLRNWALKSGAQDGAQDAHLSEYVVTVPSAQNAVDTLPGWNQTFPPEMGLKAGEMALYNDPRILWAIEQFGPLAGKRVLEVGPLEAWHTVMLDRHGPAVLDAVEANRLAFLRCLVVKEIMGLAHARFHLGDCQLWLEQREERYDLIIASGVLYHMEDPVRFLQAMAARTNSLFLWTHYVDDVAMPMEDPRRGAFVGAPEIQEALGVQVKLYPRSYMGAWQSSAFCGGTHDLHRWMERSSMLELLAAMGFSEVRIAFDQPDHPFAPAFCLYAARG